MYKISARNVLKILPLVVSGALLTACSSDDEPTSTQPPPEVADIALEPIKASSSDIKSLEFVWQEEAAEEGAVYEICLYDEAKADNGNCDQLEGGITKTSKTIKVPSLLSVGQYFVRNEDTGTVSDTLAPEPEQLLAASGFYKATTPETGDQFGNSVALSKNGQFMAVGARNEDSPVLSTIDGETDDSVADTENTDIGAVYLFAKSEQGWEPLQLLKPYGYVDNSGSQDWGEDNTTQPQFGYSLAMSEDGSTLVVGAPARYRLHDESSLGDDIGYVSIYRKKTGVEDPEWYLERVHSRVGQSYNQNGTVRKDFISYTSTLEWGIMLGNSVDVSDDGDMIVIGIPGFKEVERIHPGGVHILVRDASDDAIWLTRAGTGGGGIFPTDRKIGEEPVDNFGSTVALSGDGLTLAVADSKKSIELDKVFVYEVDQRDSWSDVEAGNFKLLKGDQGEGVFGEYFGNDLSISTDGSTIAVAAVGNSDGGTGITVDPSEDVTEGVDPQPRSGAVYLFQKEGEEWNRQARIKAEFAVAEEAFGTSIELSDDGNTLLVGASGDDNAATGVGLELLEQHPKTDSDENYGALYVYNRSAEGVWSLNQYAKGPAIKGFNFGRGGLAISQTEEDETTITTIAVPSYDSHSETSAGPLGEAQLNEDDPDSGAVFLF